MLASLRRSHSSSDSSVLSVVCASSAGRSSISSAAVAVVASISSGLERGAIGAGCSAAREVARVRSIGRRVRRRHAVGRGRVGVGHAVGSQGRGVSTRAGIVRSVGSISRVRVRRAGIECACATATIVSSAIISVVSSAAVVAIVAARGAVVSAVTTTVGSAIIAAASTALVVAATASAAASSARSSLARLCELHAHTLAAELATVHALHGIRSAIFTLKFHETKTRRLQTRNNFTCERGLSEI